MKADDKTHSAMSDTGRTVADDDDDTLVQDAGQVGQAVELSRHQQEPPARVAGYEILRCLGEGAYGSVWLAREQNTGKQVAIKFYTHRRGLDWSLLNREVEKLAVLYTSRNIVGLIDVGWDSDPPHYIMEYLESGSLDTFLKEGPLPVDEAVRIAESVLRALIHAHGSGILHCDLKPANVLLDPDFEPRLCDFGQSRLTDEQEPALGTLFYMAPEQADLKSVPDARWDVYALGALLYHMLTGAPPHRTIENGKQIQSAGSLADQLAVYRRVVRQSPRERLRKLVPGIDRRLADIVERCLHVDPEKRFSNAQVVFDMLELRERQRSRRPLVALGIIGPILLLSAVVVTVGNVMTSAVNVGGQNLTERALESDALTAKILASSLERELEDRTAELVRYAASPELSEAIAAAGENGWKNRTAVLEMLNQWKESVDDRREIQQRQQDTSWFLTDATGVQRWRNPPPPADNNTIDKNYSWRDYFHGLNKQFRKDTKGWKPIEQPHVSLAFRSTATNQWMVAISVPVWDSEDVRTRKVVGVLARTTHLGDLLKEYKASIRSHGGGDPRRTIVLVDQREWTLLDHPWMTKEHLKEFKDEDFRQLALDPRIQKKLERTTNESQKDGRVHGSDRDDDYVDPVSRFARDEYGQRWLAAFAPVGDFGWTAIVQESRDAALKPVRTMQEGLEEYLWWALCVSAALIVILWYFVGRALNDRSVRVWSKGRSYSSAQTGDSSVISK